MQIPPYHSGIHGSSTGWKCPDSASPIWYVNARSLESIEQLPTCDYTEWYLDSPSINADQIEVVVNYSYFGFRSWDGPGWCEVLLAQRIELQERFWDQKQRLQPTAYVAAHEESLLFATADAALFESVRSSLLRES